jgi:hypothetical protein
MQNPDPKRYAIEGGEYIRQLGYRDGQKQMAPEPQQSLQENRV